MIKALRFVIQIVTLVSNVLEFVYIFVEESIDTIIGVLQLVPQIITLLSNVMEFVYKIVKESSG